MTVFDPVFNKGIFMYDPDLGFRIRPFAEQSNSFGFNDREYPAEKSPETLRVMIIGDSFNWAGGQAYNYTNLLESQFTNWSDTLKVEVINTGYPGTHTGEQLGMLKKFGLYYNPDIVVLGFFAGNDFIDADPKRKRIIVNDIQIDIDKRKEIRLWGYPILLKSRLWMFIDQKVETYRAIKESNEKKKTKSSAQKQVITFNEEIFLSLELERMGFCNLKSQEKGIYKDKIDFAFDQILQMKALLDKRGIEFHVAIFPDEFQVDTSLTQKIFVKYGLQRNDYDLALMQKTLSRFLENNGIPYIDMLDTFRRVGKEKRLYLLRDTHWNKEGNKLAAEILYRYLSESFATRR